MTDAGYVDDDLTDKLLIEVEQAERLLESGISGVGRAPRERRADLATVVGNLRELIEEGRLRRGRPVAEDSFQEIWESDFGLDKAMERFFDFSSDMGAGRLERRFDPIRLDQQSAPS